LAEKIATIRPRRQGGVGLDYSVQCPSQWKKVMLLNPTGLKMSGEFILFLAVISRGFLNF
jgi:hypothetical protein